MIYRARECVFGGATDALLHQDVSLAASLHHMKATGQRVGDFFVCLLFITFLSEYNVFNPVLLHPLAS